MAKSRQDLKREYKERPKPAGVFAIKNTATDKVLLGSSLNLDGALNRHKFMLSTGHHDNKVLQQDWNEQGPEQFVFEILDVVKVRDDPNFNLDAELELLEQIWWDELKPLDRGYNTNKRIRQA